MEPIVVFVSRVKLALALASCFACATLVVVTPVTTTIRVALLVPSGSASVVICAHLVRGRPFLIITETGIQMRGWTPFAWDEVASVTPYVKKFGPSVQRYIRVTLKNHDAAMARQSRRKRAMDAANRTLGYDGSILIPGIGLNVPIDEVLAAMQRVLQPCAESPSDPSAFGDPNSIAG